MLEIITVTHIISSLMYGRCFALSGIVSVLILKQVVESERMKRKGAESEKTVGNLMDEHN